MLGYAAIAAVAISALPDAPVTPVSQSATCGVEWLQGVQQSPAVPMEWLGFPVVTSSAAVSWEALAGIAVARSPGTERLGAPVKSVLAPFEHRAAVVAVSRSVTIAVEWRGRILASRTVGWARLGGLRRSLSVPAEWRRLIEDERFRGEYLSGSVFVGRYESAAAVQAGYLSGSRFFLGEQYDL